jgi:GT2 family glycosyltransferase
MEKSGFEESTCGAERTCAETAPETPCRELSVVIVNYRMPDDTVACLDSLIRQSPGVQFDIVVVDNCSRDRSRERILSACPFVHWIQMQANAGFARAVNAGLHAAKHQRVLLLNPDTLILDAAVTKCLDFLEQQRGGGLVGCRHLNTDGSVQPSTSLQERWPSAWNAILEGPRSLLRSRLEMARVSMHSSTHETDGLQGSFIMFDKKILARAGWFDPDYFLYYEELDWARRVKNAGYSIHFLAEATIVHHRRRQKNSSATRKQFHHSQELFVIKARGKFHYLFFTLVNYVNCLLILLAWPLSATGRKSTWVREYNPLSLSHWKLLWTAGRPCASAEKPFALETHDESPCRED